MLRTAVALRRSRPVTTGTRSITYQLSPAGWPEADAELFPCDQLRIRRQNAAMRGQRRRFGGIRRAVQNQVQFKLPARLNHALGAVGIAFSGQLDNDFIVALAIGSDQRLGQSQRVDAAPNRFFGLVHGLLLNVGDLASATS